MALSLTANQQRELHEAILDYLHNAGFTSTYEQFRAEAPQMTTFEPDPTSRNANLLVKKWTSVIRLQKKLINTEQRLTEVTEELSQISRNGVPPPGAYDREWLPRAPAKRSLVGHREPLTALAFHPMFSILASACEDSTIKLWDWESGQTEHTLRGHTRTVTDCDFDSKGRYLVSCSYDLLVKVWSTDDDYANTITFTGHEHSVSSVRFLPGDEKIVSASRDQTIRIWDMTTKHCVKTIRCHETWIRSILSSNDGRLFLSCGDDHTVKLIDAQTGQIKTEMRGHDNVVQVAVFVPANASPAIRKLAGLPTVKGKQQRDLSDADFAVSGSRDKLIKIWETSSGQCITTLTGHNDWIRSLIFHPNGTALLSASDDHSVKIWDLEEGRCSKTIAQAHEKFVSCMAWCPTTSAGDAEGLVRNVMATGSADKTIKIWMP